MDYNVKKPTKNGMNDTYLPINKKKEKAANCVFLTEDRICHCKQCYYYLSYCFDSTHCPHREKEEIKIESIQKKKIKEIGCSIPEGTVVHARFGKTGVVHHYDYKKRMLYITFGDKAKPYLYPDSFQTSAIWFDKETEELMKRDIAVAIRE